MNRIGEYLQYHANSSRALDIDPQVEAIQYICNRYELSREQRYWLCFLFATNYCVATTFFMYNEFPDYATVDTGRLEKWWTQNRGKLIFQTDRAWIRSRNQFVAVFESYRDFVNLWSEDGTQEKALQNAIANGCSPEHSYEVLHSNFNVFQFGRFAMFLYTELLRNVCGLQIAPKFDIREAESSRNGLVFALGLENTLYTGRSGKSLPPEAIRHLNSGLRFIAEQIQQMPIHPRHKSLWSIETTLCAYKKHKLNGKRWVGYYIERMRKEIAKLEAVTCKQVGGGVDWTALWQFRCETYNPKYLKEI